jgi:multicomponent Na+:H+ antiporter subunit C
MNSILSHGPYTLCLAIIMVALLGIIISGNYFKKLLCLGLLQTGTIIFFISLGKIKGGHIPVLECFDLKQCGAVVDPLPQVLMLTAIVVGAATMSVGLSIIIQIKKRFGTIEEELIYSHKVQPTNEKDGLPRAANNDEFKSPSLRGAKRRGNPSSLTSRARK